MESPDDEASRIERENILLFNKLDRKLNLRRILRNNKNHLDFGCGWGFFTKTIAQEIPTLKVDGLDKDPERIEDANELRRLPNMRYICSSKVSKRYDSISATFVLHEIKDLNRYLKEFHKSLKKNGKILVYEFKKTSRDEFRKLFDSGGYSVFDFEEEYKEHNKWTIEDFRQIMENAGFKTLKIIPDNKYYLIYLGEKA